MLQDRNDSDQNQVPTPEVQQTPREDANSKSPSPSDEYVVTPSSDFALPKRKRRMGGSKQDEVEVNQILSSASSALKNIVGRIISTPASANHIDLFFQSLAAQFKLLPPEVQPQLMFEMQQCISQAQMAHLFHQGNSFSMTPSTMPSTTDQQQQAQSNYYHQTSMLANPSQLQNNKYIQANINQSNTSQYVQANPNIPQSNVNPTSLN